MSQRQEDIVSELEQILGNHKKPWRRWFNIPFQSGFALFTIYTGFSGMFHFGASSVIFAEGIYGSNLFNLISIASGYLMLSGSGRSSHSREEVVGLGTCVGMMMARSFVIISTSGWNVTTHNLLAVFCIATVASIIRIASLVKRPHLITIDTPK